MRIALILGLLLPLAAHAQDATTEDKLRDALRHSTVDLRALQILRRSCRPTGTPP